MQYTYTHACRGPAMLSPGSTASSRTGRAALALDSQQRFWGSPFFFLGFRV